MEKIKSLLNNKKVIAFMLIALIFGGGAFIKLFILSFNSEKVVENTAHEDSNGDRIIKYEAEEGVTHTRNISIKIDMPDKLKARIDFKKFKKKLEEFCDDQMLEAENLTATSDGALNENFDTGDMFFHMQLNNKARTIILCQVQGGEFSFSYH